MANDPYAEFTQDLAPSQADPYAEFTSDLPPTKMGGKPPISFVASQVMNLAPWNKINQAYKSGIGNVAEFLGRHTNLDPNDIGAVLTPLAIAPELLGTLTGTEGTAKTPLGKAITNTPQQLGEQYAAQNEIAGISGELPVRSGKLPGYAKSSADLGDLKTAQNLMLNPPVSYPKDPAAIINLAKNRVEAFGPDLTNQELSDYDSMLGNMFKLGQNRVESIAGKGAWGVLGDVKSKVNTLLSQGVTKSINETPYWPENYEPTREQLNQIYALSNKLRIAPQLAKKIWSYLGPKFRWGDILTQ